MCFPRLRWLGLWNLHKCRLDAIIVCDNLLALVDLGLRFRLRLLNTRMDGNVVVVVSRRARGDVHADFPWATSHTAFEDDVGGVHAQAFASVCSADSGVAFREVLVLVNVEPGNAVCESLHTECFPTLPLYV